jgi:hypothetical protein
MRTHRHIECQTLGLVAGAAPKSRALTQCLAHGRDACDKNLLFCRNGALLCGAAHVLVEGGPRLHQVFVASFFKSVLQWPALRQMNAANHVQSMRSNIISPMKKEHMHIGLTTASTWPDTHTLATGMTAQHWCQKHRHTNNRSLTCPQLFSSAAPRPLDARRHRQFATSQGHDRRSGRAVSQATNK